MRIAFAGDRLISVEILKYLLNQKVKPMVLLLPESNQASHSEELKKLCNYLDAKHILKGNSFKTKKGVQILKRLNLDYLISVHFPYIYPENVLEIFDHGALNLHPAYLPFNRGWHTPSWTIIGKVPCGATLHFMEKSLDTGDIVYQEKMKVLPDDTANSLYQRILNLELKVFKKAWPDLASFAHKRKKQLKRGTLHKKKDLVTIQEIKLEEKFKAKELIDRLRALTTNDIKEASYFKKGGEKYRITIDIFKDKKNKFLARFKNWQKPMFDDKNMTKWNWMCQYHENLSIKENTDIGAFTYINAKNGVIIEENVQIGSHCAIYSENTIDNTSGKVLIKKGAKVGSHTVILPGVTIGKNAIVGAQSLVKKDVANGAIVAGVTAKPLKKIKLK